MHRTISHSAALICVATLLGACAHDGKKPNTGPVQLTEVKQRDAEVVRLVEKTCPVSGPKPPAPKPSGPVPTAAPIVLALAAAAVPVVADLTVSAFRDYLERVQKEKTGNFMASGSGSLKPDVKTYCLVVARGRVGESTPEERRGQGELTESQMKDLGLAAPPAFYMEALLEIIPRTTPQPSPPPQPANDKPRNEPSKPEAQKPGTQKPEEQKPQANEAKAPVADLVFKPQYLQFARTAAERDKDGEKTVAMVLVLRSSSAPENPTSTTAAAEAEAVFPLNFGKMKQGIHIKPGDFANAANDNPLSDLKRATPLRQIPPQLNFYAFVTESADPDKVLALMTKTLEKKGDDLTKGITTAVQDAIKDATAKP